MNREGEMQDPQRIGEVETGKLEGWSHSLPGSQPGISTGKEISGNLHGQDLILGGVFVSIWSWKPTRARCDPVSLHGQGLILGADMGSFKPGN